VTGTRFVHPSGTPASCGVSEGAREAEDPVGPPACRDWDYLLSDTLIASRPLSFVRDSYVTFASIGSVIMSSPRMLRWCTKRSLVPAVGDDPAVTSGLVE
jgi:hypothetical protein